LKVKYDTRNLLSSVAFNFNLCRYSLEPLGINYERWVVFTCRTLQIRRLWLRYLS